MKDAKTPENSKKDEDIKKEFEGPSLSESLKETLTDLFQNLKRLNFQDFETVEDNRKSQPSEKSSSEVESLNDRGTNSSMRDPSFRTQKSVRKADSTQSSENNLVSLTDRLKKFYDLKSLKEQKNKIIKTVTVFIGILLIASGLIYSILGSPVNVSSNVIFGERATFSAFLVLIGFLILAGVFARKLLDRTFLKRIYSELEIAEGKVQKNQDNKQTRMDKATDKKDYKKD